MKKTFRKLEEGLFCDICNQQILPNDNTIFHDNFDLHSACLSELLKQKLPLDKPLKQAPEPKENILTRIKKAFEDATYE